MADEPDGSTTTVHDEVIDKLGDLSLVVGYDSEKTADDSDSSTTTVQDEVIDELGDLTLVVGPEHVKFRVSKHVLCRASPVWKGGDNCRYHPLT